MASLQPVRGTHDLLPDDNRRHRHVVERARAVAEQYGYHEIATPIFEFSDVFRRTLGETSDIVTKEMYTFVDRGGDELTLRPEYTAGIARAFISGGLRQLLPLKFFASGPMFRYERPQKGRLRQFHQIDVEVLGVAEPGADVEVIAMAAHILEVFGVLGRCKLELNSLGDPESRVAYRDVLVRHFEQHRDGLSEDSRIRLERNPLRILDSKDEGDRRIVAGAPLLSDHLTPAAAAFFAAVQSGLGSLGIEFEINNRLVRGLDYYTHTAFEFTTTALGAQGAVIAGGRYDGLIEAMGGPPTPGIGWAGGIERLALLCTAFPAQRRPIALVPVGAAAEVEAARIGQRLRRAGLVVDIAFTGNLSRRLKRANKVNAAYAVIVGDDELSRRAATVRDLDTGAQRTVGFDQIEAAIAVSGVSRGGP
ncbi:MAG: histidine--tRNA ligase [Alphaproteobacteria bacterium]|nr:histidine--tRNA ligase [Alphaproteobacteria bacterium]